MQLSMQQGMELSRVQRMAGPLRGASPAHETIRSVATASKHATRIHAGLLPSVSGPAICSQRRHRAATMNAVAPPQQAVSAHSDHFACRAQRVHAGVC
jgi:hypothetical protein